MNICNKSQKVSLCSRVFDLFLTKLSLPDQIWMPNWTLRHIYKRRFSFFEHFLTLLASKLTKSVTSSKLVFWVFIQYGYGKRQNFFWFQIRRKVDKRLTQKRFRAQYFCTQYKKIFSTFLSYYCMTLFPYCQYYSDWTTLMYCILVESYHFSIFFLNPQCLNANIFFLLLVLHEFYKILSKHLSLPY